MKHVIYIIISILVLQACGENKNSSSSIIEETNTSASEIKVAKTQFEQLGMKLGSLTWKAFPEVINATGMIDVPPKNKAVITAVMGGRVKKSLLLVGDKVKKGQALVTIENPKYIELQQQFLEINEKLIYLKSEYERQKTLFAENITSQKSFLKAESEFKKNRAAYNALQKQLHMLNISTDQVKLGNIASSVTLQTPIAGSITSVNVVQGSFITPTTVIMEVVDNEHIHLELSVFEKDALKLEKGQHILFQAPESSNQIFEGEIHLIGSTLDKNRTVKVHGHLRDKRKVKLLAGMFVDAQILVEKKQNMLSKALPEECIIEIDNAYQVLVLKQQNIKDYILEPITIKKGKTFKGYTEISSDKLSDTIQIVITEAFNLIQK